MAGMTPYDMYRDQIQAGYPGGAITPEVPAESTYYPGQPNPHDKRAGAMAAMMQHSGFAKPALAAAMGQAMNEGDAFDADQAKQGARAYSDKLDAEQGEKILDHILKTAEKDEVAATVMIEQAAKQYRSLAVFAGVKFSAPSERGWSFNELADGTKVSINLGKFAKAGSLPDLPDMKTDPEAFYARMEKEGVMFRMPGGADNKAPTTRTRQNGRYNVNEEWDKKTGTWKVVGGGPKDKDSDDDGNSKAAKVGTVNQVGSTWSSKWLPLALENYRKSDPKAKDTEFFDPYTGSVNEAKLRAALTPEQRGNYDRGLIDAQNGAAGGKNPAQAVDDSLRQWQTRKPKAPAADASTSVKAGGKMAHGEMNGGFVGYKGVAYKINPDGKSITVGGKKITFQ